MLRANQAVRIGLRAAARNPELAFGRALLDQAGNLLAFLPLLLALVLVFGGTRSILAALVSLRLLQWPTLGALVAAASIASAAGLLFWAGALPLLAADAELDRRPPAGNFARLAALGFARTSLAGIAGAALATGFSLACAAALLAGVAAAFVRPTPALFAVAALIATLSIAGSVLLEILGRLLLVRAAAFGEGASAAFGKAMALLVARLPAVLAVSAAFVVLDLIAAAVAGMITSVFSSPTLLDPDRELLALAPRVAVGLAAAVVLSWLEVGRMGALCALAMDAEGLIEAPVPPPPAAPIAEPVIEALPADDDEGSPPPA